MVGLKGMSWRHWRVNQCARQPWHATLPAACPPHLLCLPPFQTLPPAPPPPPLPPPACRYAYPVTCTGFTTDPATGHVTEVQATYEQDFKKPPKGVLNWVGQPAPGHTPPTFEARLYDVLFKSQSPASQVGAPATAASDVLQEQQQGRYGCAGGAEGLGRHGWLGMALHPSHHI